MVKHVVMWRYRNKLDIDVARNKLESMRGKIPTMLSIEIGVDFNRSQAAYDLVLITKHADRNALESYQNDPVHEDVKNFLGSLESERVVVDFEI